MTPKAAIKRFTEKYPTEAILSLQNMAADNSLAYLKFVSIDLTESANKFDEYLDGYIAFKTKGNGLDRVTNENIIESTGKLLDQLLFRERQCLCADALDLVLTYLENLRSLDGKLDDGTEVMLERGNEPEDIGLLTTMTEAYVEAATEKVDGIMDYLLLLSGYTSKCKLTEASRRGHRKENHRGNHHDYFL